MAQQTSQLRAKFRAKSIAVEVALLGTMVFATAVELPVAGGQTARCFDSTGSQVGESYPPRDRHLGGEWLCRHDSHDMLTC